MLTVCALAIGCGQPPLMADSRDIAMEGWSSAEPVLFHWEIQDTLKRYDVLLDVRHSQTYPYSNLYLFLTYRFPNGKSRVDTVECTLAPKKNKGERLGKVRLQKGTYSPNLYSMLKGCSLI